ncbi:glycerate kinase [Bacillus taeanensis]|uniref:Glycerate kinase n=1 Tax=Bacillus taeanensis TaxID=273032 RepID=A0A366XYN0_9BACI|nr:glycerate kinase [Bacillus taeanensis]RBW69031.1 glycerate kinase [Bacillus taeanensis]
MKVVIAIDSFKGSISSNDAAKAISSGIQDVYSEAEIISIPLADGGEGTVEALVEAANGKFITKEITGPLHEKVNAVYGLLGDNETAVIEVAAACGLPLIASDKRNPLLTTTFGVGELIKDAVNKGCRKFVIGLGGSSTNDAGVGMLQALGFRFLDQHGEEVGTGGQALNKVISIDLKSILPQLKDCTFRVACDVNNLLHGTNGAAYIFGPQKGATIDIVEELDNGLKHFADVVYQELGKDIHNISGAGAAGGLGAAFTGFLNASLQSGIELILDIVEMEKKMENADFVITGEGKLDGQTSMGKAPLGVSQLAAKQEIPVIALAGAVTKETEQLNEQGITSYFSIMNEPMSLEEAMNSETAFHNLRVTAKQLFQLINAVQK